MRKALLVPALTLSLTTAAAAQDAPPSAFDWVSVLNMRYYPPIGGFMVSDLQALLLPAGTTEGLLLVRRGSETIARDPLRIRPPGDVPAVSIAERTNPGGFVIAQAGDLTLAFQAGGRTLTEVPVTLSQQAGGDAYNPTRTWVREGPWRSLAFIAVPTADATAPLRFCWWSATRELPNRAPGNVTARTLRGTSEVARMRGPLHVSEDDWQYRCSDMSVSPAARALLNLAGLTDGSYTMVLEADGGAVVKRFRFSVSGGQIAPHPRSAPGYTPSTGHLPPRSILRSGNREAMFTISWMEAGQ